LNSISKIKIKTKTKSWVKLNSMMMNNLKKFQFEKLRFVELRKIMSKLMRFDWNETCLLLFTNNAFFCSKCVVSKFRKIRVSIDFSWIFVLLILTNLVRIIWVNFVNLTTHLLETRWMSMNMKSSLIKNITISFHLNFVIDEMSCVTTLIKIII
jgi:hypothetical protein